jgi:uncharacterized membrane protein YebE (DUF533 family)
MQRQPSQCIKEHTMHKADAAAIIAGGATALVGAAIIAVGSTPVAWAALAYGTYRMSKQAHRLVQSRTDSNIQEEDSWHV